MATRDASITVRIPKDLKDRLSATAETEERSLSWLVERILREWDEGRGRKRAR
jgi:predicted transcriptional regulator